MPQHGRGPYLYLRPARFDDKGRCTHPATWIIREGRRDRSTGCGKGDRAGAEIALDTYLGEKRLAATRQGSRDPSQIPIADVLALYLRDIAPKHARPHETAGRVEHLLAFFGADHLSDLNGNRCRQYARQRGAGIARRELEELRAAINHHRREGLCAEVVGVVLPPKGPARERWLTRSEAARLIWSAWRYREVQKGQLTDRASRQHVARFILVALYTGTRAGAVCGAAMRPTKGRGWIDLNRGVFYRRATEAKVTRKRQPPVPLPDRLLAHLRRWDRVGLAFPVEWNRGPVRNIAKAFRATARDAGLPDVTPHTLRHTTATWLMQDGVDLWEAAGYLGMSVEVLSNTYGHHHPRHLENARRAFSRHNSRHNNAGEEREQTRTNVRKIADYSRTAN